MPSRVIRKFTNSIYKDHLDYTLEHEMLRVHLRICSYNLGRLCQCSQPLLRIEDGKIGKIKGKNDLGNWADGWWCFIVFGNSRKVTLFFRGSHMRMIISIDSEGESGK